MKREETWEREEKRERRLCVRVCILMEERGTKLTLLLIKQNHNSLISFSLLLSLSFSIPLFFLSSVTPGANSCSLINYWCSEAFGGQAGSGFQGVCVCMCVCVSGWRRSGVHLKAWSAAYHCCGKLVVIQSTCRCPCQETGRLRLQPADFLLHNSFTGSPNTNHGKFINYYYFQQKAAE